MAQNIENTEKGVGWLSRLLSLEKKYGFFGIIKVIILLVFLGYGLYFVANPEYLLDKLAEAQERKEQLAAEQHAEMVNSRFQADIIINNLLTKLLYHTESSRVWVIEFHNGSKNLASGLPFLYGSMTYEALGSGVCSVFEEYSDFSLSRFPLIGTMLARGYWYGEIEDMEGSDAKLYHKFVANGVTSAALLTLYKGEEPIGVLGITYCGHAPDWEQLGIEIRKAGVQIATTLTPNVSE